MSEPVTSELHVMALLRRHGRTKATIVKGNGVAFRTLGRVVVEHFTLNDLVAKGYAHRVWLNGPTNSGSYCEFAWGPIPATARRYDFGYMEGVDER